MIDERRAHKFCKDDISKIENYNKAISDTTQTWHCHHRDEIRELPSGMIVYRSKQELIENGRYLYCPANELIFLTPEEHISLHKKGNVFSEEHRRKLSESHKGKILSAETRKKMSKANRGKHLSAETIQKLREAHLGKRHSDEVRKKLSESHKGQVPWNKGKKLKHRV